MEGKKLPPEMEWQDLPRGPQGGIAYFPELPPNSEATALWCLAAFAHDSPGSADKDLAWLLARQGQDGACSLTEEFPGQGVWVTPHLLLVAHHYQLKDIEEKALGFLKTFRSVTMEAHESGPINLDVTIPGWPWRDGTFGWVEPTAWALLALRVGDLEDDPRAKDGTRFLLDRGIPTGGWNYGNREVYSKELLPFWDTTALALLALHGTGADERIDQGVGLLTRDLEKMDSLYSLAWASLALEKFGQDAGPAKEKLRRKLGSLAREEKNSAHLALAWLALAPRRVLTK